MAADIYINIKLKHCAKFKTSVDNDTESFALTPDLIRKYWWRWLVPVSSAGPS